MKRLFIIGNGFDSKHRLPTNYSYFREYLIRKYPDYTRDYGGLLESKIGHHGEKIFDMDDVVGAIISVIDEIDVREGNQNYEWNMLEQYVGSKYAWTILNHHSYILHNTNLDINDDRYEKEYSYSRLNNEIVSNDMEIAFIKIKEIFEDWVREYFANFSFKGIERIVTPPLEDALFINFNYTNTLEKIYGIDYNNICYIHGYAKEPNSEIFFGHGKEKEVFQLPDMYEGAEEAFGSIIRGMEKDVNRAYDNHIDFFNRLDSIEEIYSFGFSFSDVDMFYINNIKNHVDLKKVIWYFNKHDCEKNRKKMELVSDMGFNVKETNIW